MTPRRPVGGDSTLVSRDEWLEGVTWYVALETPSSPEPSTSRNLRAREPRSKQDD